MEFTTRLWAAFQNNPTLGKHPSGRATAVRALHPLRSPTQGGQPTAATARNSVSLRYSSLAPTGARGFSAGLFPLRSPLLGESLLVSFPPLSDMLKFSGLSRPI